MSLLPHGVLAMAAAAACLPLAAAIAQEADKPDAHYYLQPAADDDTPRPWLILLPGGGGMDVFGDTEFYYDEARRWNALGFDALLVHYQAAAPLIEGAEGPDPGPMEARVVADALAAAKRNNWLDLSCPGFVIGFSMGGAGVLSLAADPPANLAGAVARYPLVRGQPDGYAARVPVLILQGENDRLTTAPELDAFLARASDTSQVQVIRYTEAEHGFDIPSLAAGVNYNGGTFRYHRDFAADALARIADFAERILASAPACTDEDS